MAESEKECEVVENVTPDPFDMTDKEREIINEVTTTECGSECRHCKHTEQCDLKLHFRTRYCAVCRVQIYRRMQEWLAIQFERKKARSERDGTQEFMSTCRVFYTNPASYEYVHINTNKKFSSKFPKLMTPLKSILQIPIEICHWKNRFTKVYALKVVNGLKFSHKFTWTGRLNPAKWKSWWRNSGV